MKRELELVETGKKFPARVYGSTQIYTNVENRVVGPKSFGSFPCQCAQHTDDPTHRCIEQRSTGFARAIAHVDLLRITGDTHLMPYIQLYDRVVSFLMPLSLSYTCSPFLLG